MRRGIMVRSISICPSLVLNVHMVNFVHPTEGKAFRCFDSTILVGRLAVGRLTIGRLTVGHYGHRSFDHRLFARRSFDHRSFDHLVCPLGCKDNNIAIRTNALCHSGYQIILPYWRRWSESNFKRLSTDIVPRHPSSSFMSLYIALYILWSAWLEEARRGIGNKFQHVLCSWNDPEINFRKPNTARDLDKE